MKNFLILALGLALIAPVITEKAEAYSSAVGVDPKNDDNGYGNGGYGDIETKAIVKSATASYSASITPRRVLAFGTEDDGYTVTRQVTQTAAGQRLLSCVSFDDIATGDTSYHRCITKGFVRLDYNAGTYVIEEGIPACVDSEGRVRGCNRAGGAEATVNTGIIPLESKSSGTGYYLRAIIDLK